MCIRDSNWGELLSSTSNELILENHGSVKPNETRDEKKFADLGEDNAVLSSIQILSADK